LDKTGKIEQTVKTYLVGGAVRDQLLGYPVKERDWLVIGETPESMVARGFVPVGKDFPVFLHPKTHEEYALARTERKTAPGYKGFIVHASPDVTLEQDLLRRDLTINAMAMTEAGELLDPYGGQKDLEQRVFRHVSPAFVEDPVRILRVARFAARYAHLGFKLADETRDLMQQMVMAGEVQHLVAERVWAELNKALLEKTPSAFFYTLRECGALAFIFPEIEHLFGIPQPAKYHPEIDTGVHVLMAVDMATHLSDKAEVRFAVLTHDLGKALTDPAKWPSHHGHETLGLPVLEGVCKRLKVPKNVQTLAKAVMRYHTHCHRVFDLKATTLVDMLQKLTAFKSGSMLDDYLKACEADIRGRGGFENCDYPQAEYLRSVAKAASEIDMDAIMTMGLKGKQIGEAIRQARVQAVKKFMRRWREASLQSAIP
jgi:tRNA nucleotidyltransferase (CCA-adding enzyme)